MSTIYQNCNREIKLLKLKANYNARSQEILHNRYCNREIKLLKLKANYNFKLNVMPILPIVIVR